jgi:hypothetical protein
MLERDDEDLALDQLPTAAGRADDPQLDHPSNTTTTPQEHAAEHAEPHTPGSSRASLPHIRSQLDTLRAQLQSLPTSELARLDDLDARARTLTHQHDRLRQELDRLPPPPGRRLLRLREDPHLVDRTRLTSALTGAHTQLEQTLAERATLARQLGDTDAIREERDGLTNATNTLQRTCTELRNALADRELVTDPAWAREALGEPPHERWERDRWNDAARTIARYRIEHDITTSDPLGPPPTNPTQRAHYEHAQQAREQLNHELGREPHGLDLGLG